jgi:hypothetical protein
MSIARCVSSGVSITRPRWAIGGPDRIGQPLHSQCGLIRLTSTFLSLHVRKVVNRTRLHQDNRGTRSSRKGVFLVGRSVLSSARIARISPQLSRSFSDRRVLRRRATQRVGVSTVGGDGAPREGEPSSPHRLTAVDVSSLRDRSPSPVTLNDSFSRTGNAS